LPEQPDYFKLEDKHKEFIMKCNVGGIDRTGRIVLGVVLLLVGLVAPIDMTWRIVALVIAAVALVTAIMRFCPANWMLGINTCETEEKK
jgi:hypothetical protein